MGGANHSKPPFYSSASASNNNNRKSRWENNSNTKSPSNPNTKPNPNPNPNPSPRHPPPPPSLGPPPPPAYGFHMLERRTIILADGTVRSYLALPPDYQDFPPPPPPHGRFDYHRNPPPHHHIEGPGKRKFGGGEEEDYNNNNNNNNGSEFRSNKQLRVDNKVDQDALKKAFLHFAKLINENVTLKNTYLTHRNQGRLRCLACTRSVTEFPDIHTLLMHTYNSDNADLRVDHLGLHKAVCVLMGWNYSKPPDNSKSYQFLSADEAAANQDDLIMWPPLVIIHNTNTGKSRDGRMEGYGNKIMDSRIRELGFMGGKSKSLYGRDGHLGITLIKYAGDQSGLKEATQLAEHFEKENRGRKDWARLQTQTLGKDEENNPNLVKLDETKGEKRRILYGYLGTVFDLDKVDFDTRKKVVIEIKREYKRSV
ncbi:putative XS domain-containing protein [Lupinus albus]|uniref:Putative XS domain-containing protein n=1 Tax=Lupinus albus TaxID=3870 RepID=A0A6A4QX68_LUPAL|nr:putative XS domain-containing protein [Lupinus albus]